jgi:hypothetical protein
VKRQDERNVMDVHAAAEEEARPGDGRHTWLGMVVALLAAVATAVVGILAWRWLK